MKANMRKVLLMIALFCGCSFGLLAQNTSEKQLTTEEMAEKETARLEKLLELEDWQCFYVDSTLQHDYAAMKAELEDMQRSKISNADLYVGVQDKWMEQIDNSYKKYFTEEQWKAYLKSGAARYQKAREKRKNKGK